MGHYNITLTDAAKQLCTITTPFGKYEYNRLPMGVCIAPDVFQDRMSSLFDDLEAVRVYIDDLLIVISGTFEEHLLEVEKVMQRLEQDSTRKLGDPGRRTHSKGSDAAHNRSNIAHGAVSKRNCADLDVQAGARPAHDKPERAGLRCSSGQRVLSRWMDTVQGSKV